MTAAEIYNHLVDAMATVAEEDASVRIRVGSFKEADSLRAAITIKWNAYKKQMESYGFLPPESKSKVVACAWNSEEKIATLSIRTTLARKTRDYQVL